MKIPESPPLGKVLDQLDETRPKEKGRWRRIRTYVALGCIGVTSIAALNLKNRLDEKGQGKIIPAIVQKEVEPGQGLTMCSLNMHDETAGKISMLKDLMESENCDPLVLQEVSKRDIDSLNAYFPDRNIVYVIADAVKQRPFSGGLGNVMITQKDPRDDKRISIEGTPPVEGLLAAAGKIVPNLTVEEAWASAGDELQEDRGAVAMTIPIGDEGKEKTMVAGTTHIVSAEKDGQPNEEQRDLHVFQLDKGMDFADKVARDEPAVFCGDYNSSREEMEQASAKIGFVLAENKDGRTSVNNNVETDYCLYQGAGVLGRGVVEVLSDYSTDHYAIKITFNGDQTNDPIIDYTQKYPLKK